MVARAQQTCDFGKNWRLGPYLKKRLEMVWGKLSYIGRQFFFLVIWAIDELNQEPADIINFQYYFYSIIDSMGWYKSPNLNFEACVGDFENFESQPIAD